MDRREFELAAAGFVYRVWNVERFFTFQKGAVRTL
jgi:hypothetical protein